jgi:hypothetical protein
MAQHRPPSGEVDEQDLMTIIKSQQITINNLTDLANEQIKIISQLISTAEPAAKAAVITALQTRVTATK